jgi:hypothetical protein
MGTRDRRVGEDQTEADTEATGEGGEATGMDQRGARLMAKRANGEGTKIVKVPSPQPLQRTLHGRWREASGGVR